MPLPRPIQASGDIINVSLPNATAATVMYIPLGRPGRLTRMLVTPTAATATGNATFQLAYAPPGSTTFTDITNALVTVASGALAGSVANADIGPSTTAFVQDGGCLRITVGGTATGGGTPQVAIVRE